MSSQPQAASHFTLQPIGVIHTPYKDKYLAPRQPGIGDANVEGIITLFPHNNFEQALHDLEGFERIWVLSWFHKNTDWKPKVLPPRSGRKKRGVFATRSPHRPNPIGLSLCKLLAIEGLVLRIENPDLLDGTPILDIKPYIPYVEAFPDSRSGWLETLHNASSTFNISVNPLALEQSRWLEEFHKVHILDHAKETLSLDPYPHPFRRTKLVREGEYVLGVKSWRVCYTIDGDEVHIERIESGYSLRELTGAKKRHINLHDEEAHRGFYEKWKG